LLYGIDEAAAIPRPWDDPKIFTFDAPPRTDAGVGFIYWRVEE